MTLISNHVLISKECPDDRAICMYRGEQDHWYLRHFLKGHPPSADLRYGEKDTFSPSTLIFATRKG